MSSKIDNNVITLRPMENKGGKGNIENDPDMVKLKRMIDDGEVDPGRTAEYINQLPDEERVHELEAEVDALKRIIRQRNTEIAQLEEQIEHLKATGSTTKNIDGWTARMVNGYLRVYKSIKGKVHSIHIGKELDEEKARAKIAAKMKDLEEKGVL